MILTKEQLDEYRSELPRSIWNKHYLTNFLDTIADLESRLKAAMERARIIEEMYDQEYGLEHGTIVKQLNQVREAATEMGPCGKHSKSFTKPACNHAVDCPCSPYCTICYEFDRAYKEIERLHNEATEKSECGHPRIFEQRVMRLPKNSDHPEFSETHIEDSWCPKAGCTLITSSCTLCAEIQAAYERGSNWMLDAIRGTLKGYPNHGGDIEVMREVERIEKAAYKRGLRDAAPKLERATDLVRFARHFLHDENLISDDEYAEIVQDNENGKRVARLEGYDKAILALKDQGAKGGRG